MKVRLDYKKTGIGREWKKGSQRKHIENILFEFNQK